MKIFWRPSKQLLGGYSCVEHVETKELSLFGKYGEIFQHDSYTFKVIIYSNRIAKRYLPKDRWPMQPGDETLISFPAKDLGTWVRRLGVPIKPTTQATFANLTKANIEDSGDDILSLEAQDRSKTVDDTNPEPLQKSIKFGPGNENPDGDEKMGSNA